MRVFGEGLTTFTQWFAWTLSVVASIFFLYFLFGDVVPNIVNGKGLNELKFFVLLAISGCFLSFFRLKPGGLMMLIGAIGMITYFYIMSGLKDFGMMVVYGLPYILAGLLFLLVKKK